MRSSHSPEDLTRYLSDESRLPGGSAEAVYWPETPVEAGEALAEQAAGGQLVTVSGGGTGIAGGRVPFGGVVLATDRLNRILALERDPITGKGWMRVQAGVPLAEVQAAAESERLWYPPDPTENSCFVGGSLATNASGARTFRFGASRRWVRWIQVALADGTLLDLPRGRVVASGGRFEIPRPNREPLSVPAPDWKLPGTTKHAAGFFSAPGMDLVDLFIGSEGTLGVILEAELELISAPAELLSGILFFNDERQALALVSAARGDGVSGAHGVIPLALEFFDGAALALLRRQEVPVPREAQAAILFEQSAGRGADVDALLEGWFVLAEEHQALADSWLAQEPAEQKRFREFRHLVPVTVNEMIARRGVRKVSTDTAVPRGKALLMLDAFRRILASADLENLAFGHIGDDHLHVNVLPRDLDQLAEAKALYGRMVREAVAMGGTISAEHGLGKIKGQDLGLLYPPPVLERMRAIKTALDPLWRLGRGTLFPQP